MHRDRVLGSRSAGAAVAVAVIAIVLVDDDAAANGRRDPHPVLHARAIEAWRGLT